MNFYPTFSPCPEAHKPEDVTERLIAACRWRLSMGMTSADIMSEMTTDDAATRVIVHYCLVAAQLLA